MGKRTWSDEDYRILREVFPEGGIYKCMELFPDKTRKQIKGKIDALKIKSNRYKKWTNEDVETLKKMWADSPKQEILNALPGRSWENIENKVRILKLKSSGKRMRTTDLSFLELEELTPQSAYWWGFIMADGHLSKQNALIITLKDTDIEHLKKIAKKINGNVIQRNGFCHLFAEDKNLMLKWKSMLNMVETAKTYFPPKLSIFQKYFIYFFIGFVDGDGCIWLNKNYPQLKIELHSSWYENLMWFKDMLAHYGIKSTNVKINKKGSSCLTIGNADDIKKISCFVNNVDFLERKWNKILNHVPTDVEGMHKKCHITDLETQQEYETLADCVRKTGHSKVFIKAHKERFQISKN